MANDGDNLKTFASFFILGKGSLKIWLFDDWGEILSLDILNADKSIPEINGLDGFFI